LRPGARRSARRSACRGRPGRRPEDAAVDTGEAVMRIAAFDETLDHLTLDRAPKPPRFPKDRLLKLVQATYMFSLAGA